MKLGALAKPNIEMALKSRSYTVDLDHVKLSLGIFFILNNFQDLPSVLSKTYTKKAQT